MQKGFASGAYIPALGKKPLILPENMEQILPLTVWKPCAVCTLPDFRLYGRTCISWEKSGGCLFNTVSTPEDMTTLRKGS